MARVIQRITRELRVETAISEKLTVAELRAFVKALDDNGVAGDTPLTFNKGTTLDVNQIFVRLVVSAAQTPPDAPAPA